MRSKFAVLAILLIVALSAISVGYAYWTETLYINGTVQAGELDVAFAANPSATDNESVANCSASVSSDGNTLEITISNAYPGYECTVDFAVENVGTIPVDLKGVSTPTAPAELAVTASGATANDLAVNGSANGQIKVKVNESATEGANYTFSATILAQQFNAP